MGLLEMHRSLLRDEAAQEAYRRAISRSLRGGEAVLDLGTGTGVHALFACQAGARIVYAVDADQFIELAKAVCAANGCSDRVRFFHGLIEEVDLPEKVDVIFGHHGLSRLMELLPVARERFLKPGGTLIPFRAELFAAPLESAEAWEKAVSCWEQPHLGLSFAPVRAYAVNNRHLWLIDPRELLSDAANLGPIDFLTLQNAAFVGAGEATIARPGVVHGLGMWFVQWLAPGISVGTTPPCTLPLDLWNNDFLPIEDPVPVQPGERVGIRLHTGVGGWGRIWKWEVEVRDRHGHTRARFAHSSFAHQLVTREITKKQSLEYQPNLTARGQAARFVLESCDGNRPLRWIEEEVVKRFPGVFSTPGEAAGLVASVISKYTR